MPPRRRRQKMAAHGCASTLAFEMSDGAQRLVVNCGGPDPLPAALPAELVEGLRTTAAHSTLILADTNSTAILPDGSLGKGVEDVAIDRSEDNDCSRLEASHDGYVRGFGLIHKRSLMLGNDGKELRGDDQLIAKGRKKIRESAPFAVRFHLAPGVEADRSPPTAWARSSARPARRLELPLPRRQARRIEESLWIDGRGQMQRPTTHCHRRRSLGIGRRNRLAVPPRQLINKDYDMTDLVPVRRALISLSDKTGLDELAAGLAAHGVETGLDRRHRGEAARVRRRGARHFGSDRLSRDDGRAGEDASPEGAWRPARRARQSGTCGGDGRA